jgi:hypothetical protein
MAAVTYGPVGISFLSGNELRALRIKLGQELRRVMEVIRLGYNREVSIELKPSSGYRVTITVHHSEITGKSTLRGAALTDVETGEITEIPGELFRPEAPASGGAAPPDGRATG